jgi:deoxyguanosine kinase
MSAPVFEQPRYIALEGPIRLGKSTLARILAEQLHARNIWDCNDNPFLGDFYEEKPGAAFRAQMHFLFERYRRLAELDLQKGAGPILSDFVFQKDKIFAYVNLDNEELKLYERYYAFFAASLPVPDLIIYLQAKPDVLRARIHKKGERQEAHISGEYLATIAQAYEHFFFRYSASNLLVVDTSEIDFVERNEDLQELLRRLRQPVKGTQYYLPLGPA